MSSSRRYPAVVWAVFLVVGLAGPADAENAVDSRMRRDITFLASDECEGRGVTTQGINRAADYIAAQFREAGIQPAAPGYFQHFTIPGAVLTNPNSLRLKGPLGQITDLRLGDQFQPMGYSDSGKVSAPLVFAGYGITAAPEIGYDDYKGIDVAGKVVVVLRDQPRGGNKAAAMDGGWRYSSLNTKASNAAEHGAAAVLLVNDREVARQGDDLLNFGYTAVSGFMAGPRAKIPAMQVRRSVVGEVVQSVLGKSLRELEEDIDRTMHPASAALPGWTVSLEVNVRRDGIPVKNVVGVLEGAGPLARETVILGAHYDHLGFGGPGSLANTRRPAIHHGADDNGSGTTSLIELARRLGRMVDRQGRRLVFMAFSGEEMGLLESEYYCRHPIFPLDNTVAMINMDMVGRLRPDERGRWSSVLALLVPAVAGEGPDAVPLAVLAQDGVDRIARPREKLTTYGTGTAPTFNALIDEINQKYDFKLKKIPGGMGPSDHASFYAKKIPVFFFFTDDHADYHRPSDTADKINVAGMHRIVDMVEELALRLAQVPERPQYVRARGERSSPGRMANMPRLSIKPGNYGEEEGGVLVGEAIEGGAAARAGIKDGDRIVAIAGKEIKNMTGYMDVLVTQKKGEPLEVIVLRGGKRIALSVKPD